MTCDTPAPTSAQVEAWMKNHTNVPLAGIPRSFIERLTEAADGKEDDLDMKNTAKNAKKPVLNVKRPSKDTINNKTAKRR